MKKPCLWGKGDQIEKRVMGDDDVADRIYRGGIRATKTRAESMASGKLLNLIKVCFLSALTLGLGLPHQSTLAAPMIVGF